MVQRKPKPGTITDQSSQPVSQPDEPSGPWVAMGTCRKVQCRSGVGSQLYSCVSDQSTPFSVYSAGEASWMKMVKMDVVRLARDGIPT